MDVLCAESVFVAVLEESVARVYHKDAVSDVCVLFINNEDTRWDTRPVEQIGRKTDDAFNIATADEFSTDVRLLVAAEEDTVRQDNRAFASALERCR